MRVVVLGGTRFIGRAVVAELVAAGHDVLVVHRGQHEPVDLPDVPHCIRTDVTWRATWSSCAGSGRMALSTCRR